MEGREEGGLGNGVFNAFAARLQCGADKEVT